MRLFPFRLQSTNSTISQQSKNFKSLVRPLYFLYLYECDWNLSASHLAKALKSFKVPEKETKEVLNLVASLKTDIVEK